jgi:hypothetical protein
MVTGKYIPSMHPYSAHPDHCFDYLRQSILCNFDFTFEPAVVDFDGKRRRTVGWGTEHQCYNYNEIRTFIKGNREYERAHPAWVKKFDSDPLPPEKMDPVPHCTFGEPGEL